MSKVKNELQLALRELEDLKIQREKHEKLFESVSDQRDTYQRLLENQSAKVREFKIKHILGKFRREICPNISFLGVIDGLFNDDGRRIRRVDGSK